MALTGIPSSSGIGIPTVAKVDHDGILSSIVATQLPQFVQHEHPKFVQFLEAYYEWMETQGQLIHGSENIPENKDIDTTVEEFIEFFRKAYLVNISSQILTPKDIVLKNAKDYYRSRGSEKSFQFFLRILLGQEASFYYPRVDMLKASDGKWIQVKALRITISSGDPFQLVGLKIRGVETNSTATVEKVFNVEGSLIPLYELQLNTSSIRGNFSVDENVVNEDIDIIGKISPVISSITITNKGAGYQTGQEIVIGGAGSFGTAEIISVSSTGGVLKTKVTNPGFGYTSATSSFPLYAGVTVQATGTVNTSGIINYPGYYLNEDGQLSTTKYLQDSYYYQQFSYVVKIEEALNTYKEQLKKALHPAGLKLFGEVLSANHVDNSLTVTKGLSGMSCSTVERRLQDFHTPLFLGQYAVSQDSKIKDETVPLYEIDYTFQVETYGKKLGPSLNSIERDKFRYLVDLPFDPLEPIPSPYYLLNFKDISIKDMIDRPNIRTNYAIEPYIRTKSTAADDFPDYSDFIAIYDPNVAETSDSQARTSQLTDISIFGNNATQGTNANKPLLSRADNKGNIRIYSRTYSNAAWVKNLVSVTDNYATNYAGGTTAARSIASAGAGEHRVIQNSTGYFPTTSFAGNSYKLTGWFKYVNHQYIWFGDGADSAWHGANIDIQNGTIQNTNGLTASSITAAGNGFYKVELTYTQVLTGGSITYISHSYSGATTGSAATFTAVGTEEFLIGGTSFRYSGWDSDEIVTVGAPQFAGMNGNKMSLFDGSDDYISANSLGALLSGSSKPFTVIAVYRSEAIDAAGRTIWAFGNSGSNNQIIKVRQENGQLQVTIKDDSGTTKSIVSSTGVITAGSNNIVTLTSSGTTGFLYLNSNQMATGDMSVAAATFNLFTICAQGRIAYNEQAFFRIAFLAVVPKRLELEKIQTWETYLKKRFNIS